MNFAAKYVQCPFFVDTRGEEIICEGLKDDMRTHHTFVHHNENERRKMRNDYVEEFCCKRYKDCRLAKMLYQKYEEQ